MQRKKIIVVGGGPAGIMAAIRAAELGQDVILAEKNPALGKKLLLSGKGRCNLTNACELTPFLERFSSNSQFLRDAFKVFFNTELMEFFKKRGLLLKIERQLRVFPVTDTSESVLSILTRELDKNKVRIIYNCAVKNILIKKGIVEGVELSDRVLFSHAVILACGGISYGFTGSTGEGLKIAERLGHHIVPLRPGLVALKTREHYPKLLRGITLKNVRLSFSAEKKKIVSEIGELLFTDFGVSGPLVLTLSGKIIDWQSAGKKIYLEIDLKPALSVSQLEARLLREFNRGPKKNIKSILKGLLPARLADVFAEISGISPDKKTSQVSQAERQKIILLLKGWRLEICGFRPIKEAMVTRGGVSLKDIDPRTMQSRIIKGLYFAGEMIDVDADTGGFNLQAAFSTGYLAGQSAALASS